ncbi:MAG TPA: DegT/DnrJ/EryC1/StrS family aminotransferase [Pirellulales bacterium]|nr:DegT/DnrJ/EryC1/StrS family aminotransferase [Pirellulales bacterium]
MPSLYDRLGVPKLINAAGTLTRLGGSLMDAEVVAAMAEASRSFVRMDQLHAAAGERIAELTGAAAGLVTTGAAASLTLSAAACLAGTDFARMDRLPDTSDMPNEIVIPRSHRNGYDHALRAAGARLVEVGLAERTRDPQPWEIAAAVNDRTVAIAFSVGFSPLPLEEVVVVAREHGVPVIVDASAALPPRGNLRKFITAGADLVAYSGGKAIRGPQASGILCGRRDLVASAALQMWDMDFLPELWNPPPALVDPAIVKRGVPNHGLGRAMKVGKEEIAGLLVALERFVAGDDTADRTRLAAVTKQIAAGLGDLPGASVSLVEREELWPVVRLEFASTAPKCAIEVARALESGSPPVYLATGDAHMGRLGIDPFCVQPGEAEVVVERVRAAFDS